MGWSFDAKNASLLLLVPATCIQVCDGLTHAAKPVCAHCSDDPQLAVAVMGARATRLQVQHALTVQACLHCGGGGGPLSVVQGVAMGGVVCQSLDCGLYFERWKLRAEAVTAQALCDAGMATIQ